jgi:heat shock protein HtpX
MNGLKTALLLGLLSGVLLVGGQLLGGTNGLLIGLLIAVGMNFFGYFYSEKMALAMYHAQPVTPQQNPQIHARLYPMTQQLVDRMGIPMPKLWVIPGPTPNAFATGRNPEHSSVAVTEGLLAIMNDRELEGVVAHELGHVKNRDILISSIAATLGAAITYLAYFGMFFGGGRSSDDEEGGGGGMGALLMIFLAPMAAGLIQMAVSRTREYSADAAAARYTGSPDGLISALSKLEVGNHRYPMLQANEATAHMFIVHPFSGKGLAKLFSTHPPTEDRIAALQSLRGLNPAA